MYTKRRQGVFAKIRQTEMSSDEPLEPDPANTGVGMGQSTAHF